MDASAPLPFDELPVGARRRLLARAALVSAAVLALLLASYFSVPATGADRGGDRGVGGGELAIRIVLAVVALVVALLAAVRYVGRARYPVVGLVQSLALVVGLAVVSFAATHLVISSNDPSAFSEPLDHVGALYFTLTTATTIGYGDIAPKSDLARVVVMVHMVVNVVVVGLGVRALVRATRRRIA